MALHVNTMFLNNLKCYHTMCKVQANQYTFNVTYMYMQGKFIQNALDCFFTLCYIVDEDAKIAMFQAQINKDKKIKAVRFQEGSRNYLHVIDLSAYICRLYKDIYE